MQIALINASPKRTGSASAVLLNDLKGLLSSAHTIKSIPMHKPTVTEEQIAELSSCDAWVFACPLYVDSLPSHLVACLSQLAQCDFGNKKITVYGIINAGFYEGIQNHIALDIFKNWCAKAGLHWGMGIGYGGGAALGAIQGVTLGKGPKTSLGKAFKTLVDAIRSGSSGENIYTAINFPRFAYKISAEMSMRKALKANGGKASDIHTRL